MDSEKVLSPYLFNAMNAALAERIEIVADVIFLQELLQGTTLEKELLEFPEFDTLCCAHFLDLFAQKLIHEDWPLNADTAKESVNFFMALKKEIKNNSHFLHSGIIPDKTISVI